MRNEVYRKPSPTPQAEVACVKGREYRVRMVNPVQPHKPRLLASRDANTGFGNAAKYVQPDYLNAPPA